MNTGLPPLGGASASASHHRCHPLQPRYRIRALELCEGEIQFIPQDLLTIFRISKEALGTSNVFCIELGDLQEEFYGNSV